MAAPDDMPDLSHLTEEERKIIQEVLQRQKAEENKEHHVQQQNEKELEDVERQINERKEIAMRQIGTQNDAICQICHKTKFVDGIGHKCYYCQLRSCARCGGRTQIKVKDQRPSTAGIPGKQQQQQQAKNVWACSLCQKRQTILAKTGKWFHKDGTRATTPTNLSPITTPTPPHQTPNSLVGSGSQEEFRSPPQPNGSANRRTPLALQQPQAPSSSVSGAKPMPSQSGLPPQQVGGPYMANNHQPQQPSQSSPQPQGRRQQSIQRQASLERRTSVVDQNSRDYPPQQLSGDRRLSQDSIRSGQSSIDRRSLDDRRYPPDTQQDQYRGDQRYKGDPRYRDDRSSIAPVVDDRSYDNRVRDDVTYDRDRGGPIRSIDNRSQSPSQRRGPGSDPGRPMSRNPSYDRPSSPKYSAPSDQRYPPTNTYYDEKQPTRDTYRDEYDRDRGPPPMDDRMKIGQAPASTSQVDNRQFVNEPKRSDYDYDSKRSSVRDSDMRKMSSYDRDRDQSQFGSDRDSDRRYGPDTTRGSSDRDSDRRSNYDRDSVRSGSDRELDPRRSGDYYNGGPSPPMSKSRRESSQHERGIGVPAQNLPAQNQRHYDDGRTSPSFRDRPQPRKDVEPIRNDEYYYDRSKQAQRPISNEPQLQQVERRRLPQVEDSFHSMPHQPSASTKEPLSNRRSQGSSRNRLDASLRGDSMSSDVSDALAKSPNSPYMSSSKHHHNKHGTNRHARNYRKQRSFSSSDEELPSTSECQSCEDVEGGNSSETGLLRYLLGAHRLKNNINPKLTGDLEKLNSRLLAATSDSHAHLLAGAKQLPVTWQPNADGSRMIGHMILHRHTTASLGLKVVGGRPTTTGRLGAFITRVKRGSIADIVGHLRPGDEVLEWNGRQLQNASFDEVCDIINESKHDSQIELVVSRLTGVKGAQDLQALKNKTLLVGPQLQVLDPVNNLVSRFDTVNLQQLQGAIPVELQAQMAGAPVVMITAPADLQTVAMPPVHIPQSKGQIFGKIEIALLYSPADEQLVVTTYQAMDLPPRNDGALRNPYVKLFLLPDRSEKSRRQSNVLANTCHPIWQQSFIYQRVTQIDLAIRVLEITLWDYDQFTTNDFLGEVLFDLATSLLDNEPRWYALTDMDEESPVRIKLRQQRLSAYTNQGYHQAVGARNMSYDYNRPNRGRDILRPHSSSGYRSDSGLIEAQIVASMPRSRTYHRSRYPDEINQDDLEMDMYGGYYSDHGHQSRALRRLPKAFGINRPPADLRPGSPTDLYADMAGGSRRHLPRIPPDLYGEEAMRELDDKVQQLRSQGYAVRRHHSANNPLASAPISANNINNGGRRRSRVQQPFDVTSPPTDANVPGYLSDGSETSMSITSTQSERIRTRTAQEFQNSLEAAQEENETYDGQDGTMSDSAMGSSTGPSGKSSAFAAEAKRKKSLMTRLIPGRAGSAQTLQEQKRLGFRRSDEVGIPCRLSPQSSMDLVKQASKESTDSSDSSWMPVIQGEGCLGEFVPGLGPGQVVGRQVLASPCMGEIQLHMVDKGGGLQIKVIRARHLVKKPSAKYNPAPYVKVYLMDGKYCIAKAKTTVAARTAEPKFDQHLVFTEPYRGRFLQISVWGDYSRMERRSFMGIALIRLDNLDLSRPVEGWYKLYHGSSLVGTSSPARKDSEVSMSEPAAATVA